LAISHSLVHFGVAECEVSVIGLEADVRPHGTDWFMRPQGQDKTIGAVHGSVSGQDAGA